MLFPVFALIVLGVCYPTSENVGLFHESPIKDVFL